MRAPTASPVFGGAAAAAAPVRLSPAEVKRIFCLVASNCRAEMHREAPIVSTKQLPHGEGVGARFGGPVPPVALVSSGIRSRRTDNLEEVTAQRVACTRRESDEGASAIG